MDSPGLPPARPAVGTLRLLRLHLPGQLLGAGEPRAIEGEGDRFGADLAQGAGQVAKTLLVVDGDLALQPLPQRLVP